MSLFSSIGSALGSIGKVSMAAIRSPIGSVAKSIPGVGMALTAADLGANIYSSFGSAPKPAFGGSALPPLPAGFGGSKMTVGTRGAPTGSTVPAIAAQHGAELSAYGIGGRHKIAPAQAFQMLVAAGVTLGSNYWRTKHMAPPGYVMIKDPISGTMAAVPKKMAISAGLWKPHAKPPISVRQWHALKHAKAAIKHLHKVEKAAHIVTHATTRHAPAPKALPFQKKRK